MFCRPVFDLAVQASAVMNTPVVDRTGLAGLWSYHLLYAGPTWRSSGLVAGEPVEDLPAFPAALQERLGLRLESTRGPVDVLVIESVQRPTEN